MCAPVRACARLCAPMRACARLCSAQGQSSNLPSFKPNNPPKPKINKPTNQSWANVDPLTSDEEADALGKLPSYEMDQNQKKNITKHRLTVSDLLKKAELEQLQKINKAKKLEEAKKKILQKMEEDDKMITSSADESIDKSVYENLNFTNGIANGQKNVFTR